MSELRALLAGLALGVPALPDASCRGSTLWDPAAEDENRDEVAYRLSRALVICRGCPCLTECRQWFDGLPKYDRPSGVVAGRLVGSGLRGKQPVVA